MLRAATAILALALFASPAVVVNNIPLPSCDPTGCEDFPKP